MIAKIIIGSQIKGLLQYLTSKKNDVLTTNHLLPNLNLNELVNEFKTISSLNKRSKKTVMHIVLSFPSHENLTEQKMTLITEDFLEAFGAKENMSISIRHYKESNPHVHCAINRVKDDGTLLSDSFSHIKAKTICRKLEKVHDLHKVSNYKSIDVNVAVDQLREIVDLMLIEAQNLEQFIALMEKNNYKVLKGRGITFVEKSKGIKIKGSALGRNYSLSNIQRKITEPIIENHQNKKQGSNNRRIT